MLAKLKFYCNQYVHVHVVATPTKSHKYVYIKIIFVQLETVTLKHAKIIFMIAFAYQTALGLSTINLKISLTVFRPFSWLERDMR